MNKIIIELTISEMLEDIDKTGHRAFMNSYSNCEEASRKAMIERINYYQNLLREGKIKIKVK